MVHIPSKCRVCGETYETCPDCDTLGLAKVCESCAKKLVDEYVKVHGDQSKSDDAADKFDWTGQG